MSTKMKIRDLVEKKLPPDHELRLNSKRYPIDLDDLVKNNPSLQQTVNELIKLHASKTQIKQTFEVLDKAKFFIYNDISTFTFLIDYAIIKYASLFKNSKYLAKLSPDNILTDEEDLKFHKHIIMIRDKVIAHQDKNTGYLVHKIWVNKELDDLYFPFLIIGSLDFKEIGKLERNLTKILSHIKKVLKEKKSIILEKINPQN